jgi:hypothetical protein
MASKQQIRSTDGIKTANQENLLSLTAPFALDDRRLG